MLTLRQVVVASLLASFSATAQVLPSAPQSATDNDGSDGPGWVRVKSSLQGGVGGFVDVPGYQSCRYVTSSADQNADDLGEGIPMQSLSNWQNWLTESSAIGDTATVCCRPATPALNSAAMCNDGGTATAVTPVNGTGTNGYGQLGTTGTATATCDNGEYGKYQSTVSYTCAATGSGITADGAWGLSGSSDKDTCTANSYTVTGGCSASCGGGNFYQTIYNSCGVVTSQGYTGASCNTQSCCTPVYSKSCSGSTATYTDTACGDGSYEVTNGCTYVTETVGGTSCSFGIPDYAPGGASPSSSTYTEFLDCGGPGLSGDTWTSWGTTSGAGVSCASSCSPNEPWYAYTNGAPSGSGTICGVNSSTCTYSGWQ
jgi:hypothetical protein